MATEDVDGLRAYYDTHDASAELEAAELDESTVAEPMVGITIRLPATVLDAARGVARERGIKVTALLREWIEHGLGSESGDDRLVSVRDLKSFIAQKSMAQGGGSKSVSRSRTTREWTAKTMAAHKSSSSSRKRSSPSQRG